MRKRESTGGRDCDGYSWEEGGNLSADVYILLQFRPLPFTSLHMGPVFPGASGRNLRTIVDVTAHRSVFPVAPAGSNLRTVTDLLISRLRAATAATPHSMGDSPGEEDAEPSLTDSSGSGGGSLSGGSWQLNAASVVVVTSEVLFGASPAWEPPFAASSGPVPSLDGQQPSSCPSPVYEGLVLQVLQELVRPQLWGVQTVIEGSAVPEAATSHQLGGEEDPAGPRLAVQVGPLPPPGNSVGPFLCGPG